MTGRSGSEAFKDLWTPDSIVLGCWEGEQMCEKKLLCLVPVDVFGCLWMCVVGSFSGGTNEHDFCFGEKVDDLVYHSL